MKIVLLLTLLCTGINRANAATSAKAEFLKKFPLKEGHYQAIPEKNSNWEYCEDEELDIDLRDNEGRLALTIGSRLDFPTLEKKEDTSPSEKNCLVKTVNSFKDQTFKQSISEKCGKKVTSQKTHFLKLQKDTLFYEFSTAGETHRCQYLLMAKKEGAL